MLRNDDFYFILDVWNRIRLPKFLQRFSLPTKNSSACKPCFILLCFCLLIRVTNKCYYSYPLIVIWVTIRLAPSLEMLSTASNPWHHCKFLLLQKKNLKAEKNRTKTLFHFLNLFMKECVLYQCFHYQMAKIMITWFSYHMKSYKKNYFKKLKRTILEVPIAPSEGSTFRRSNIR